jgi:hypothetical protein
MKSEPDAYGWDDLVAQGEGTGTACGTIVRQTTFAP